MAKKTRVITFRVEEDEGQIYHEYSKAHGLSLSDAFRQALSDKIEDELDIRAYEEGMKDYAEAPLSALPFSEMWREEFGDGEKVQSNDASESPEVSS